LSSICKALGSIPTPVVPATQKAEAGGSLELRSSRPAWVERKKKLDIKTIKQPCALILRIYRYRPPGGSSEASQA
jgi:hypothetical protein